MFTIPTASNIDIDLTGSEFVAANWHNSDNGWTFMFLAGGSDKGHIRGLDMVQWPFPHRLDNMDVDHPTGVWAFLLEGPAIDWQIDAFRCRGGVIGAHLLGSPPQGMVTNAVVRRPYADNCVYGSSFNSTLNSRLEDGYANGPCRALFLRSNYGFTGSLTARNENCQSVLIENEAGFVVTDGITLDYKVLPWNTGASASAVVTAGSNVVFMSQLDNFSFGWPVTGTGIPTGTVSLGRRGEYLLLSQPATASGSNVTLTTTPLTNFGFTNCNICIYGAGLTNAIFSNINIHFDYDGTGYKTGFVPLIFGITGLGSSQSGLGQEYNGIHVWGVVRNLPAAGATPCTSSVSYTQCLFDIFDHASQSWSGNTASNIQLGPIDGSNAEGSPEGGIHMDGTPFFSDRPLVLSHVTFGGSFSPENDATGGKYRLEDFSGLFAGSGVYIGQSYGSLTTSGSCSGLPHGTVVTNSSNLQPCP